MKRLIEKINSLKKGNTSRLVQERIKDFEANKTDTKKIFSELCFCLLAANFQAEKSIRIQEKLGGEIFKAEQKELAEKLKKEGHRFWPQRAEFIVLAREKINKLLYVLKNESGIEVREWLVNNVKGLGMKEASHFLRNIGYKDVAIIDFHVIDLLVREKVVARPNSLTKKRYLEIEGVLEKLAKKVGLNLSELDLYLWYLETGKVLK